MYHTLQVNGIITAETPITVSPPGVKWASDSKTSPTRMPSMGHGRSSVRYIPASTMRHVIRHGISVLVSNSVNLPLSILMALDRGFIPQKKKGKKKSGSANDPKPEEVMIRQRELQEKNPLLQLLGVWTTTATLQVRNAIPVTPGIGQEHYQITPGVVRKELESDLVAGLSSDDLSAYIEVLNHSREDKEDQDATGLKHFTNGGWEEILPQTELEWGYGISRPSLLQSGAVLAALRFFALDPRIGGHRAQGRGKIRMQLQADNLQYDQFFAPQKTPCGSLELAEGHFQVTGELETALKYFQDQMQAGFPTCDFSVLPLIGNEEG